MKLTPPKTTMGRYIYIYTENIYLMVLFIDRSGDAHFGGCQLLLGVTRGFWVTILVDWDCKFCTLPKAVWDYRNHKKWQEKRPRPWNDAKMVFRTHKKAAGLARDFFCGRRRRMSRRATPRKRTPQPQVTGEEQIIGGDICVCVCVWTQHFTGTVSNEATSEVGYPAWPAGRTCISDSESRLGPPWLRRCLCFLFCRVTWSLLDGSQVTVSRTYTHSRLISCTRDSSVVLEGLALSLGS